MNQNNIALTFLILVLGLSACQTSTKQMTKSGYEYELHIDNATEKLQPGEFAYFMIDIYNDKDSIIQTVRNGPELPVTQILGDEVMAKQGAPNPVMDAMKAMGLNDSLSLYVPLDSISAPLPDSGSDEYIKYDIVIKEIVDRPEYERRIATAKAEDEARMADIRELEPEIKALGEKLVSEYTSGKLDSDIIRHDSGLQIYMIEEGKGPNGKPGQLVETYYFGFLLDGTSFDNSYKAGRPYPVNLGSKSVIEGWEIALRELNEGAKAFIIIPYSLAYGVLGNPPTIPEKSDLCFYIEVGDIYY